MALCSIRSTSYLGFAVIHRLFFCCILFAIASHAAAQVPTQADIEKSKSQFLPDDPAATLAVVGRSPILLGDMLPRVEARIADVTAKTGQEIPEEQLRFARINLTRGMLAQSIQNKMMRESFLIDQVGTENADKHVEADGRLSSKARQMFYESELPELKEQYETDDLAELDKLLKKKGSSVAAREREFVDMMLGHLYIRSKVNKDPNVTIAEINEYYLTNQDEFRKPTRARWEQLTVLFSRFPSKENAQKEIWDIGREAFYGGNLQAVAKNRSQEAFANQGGLHDWTAKDSLASEPLNAQIFSLPTNVMSEIIEDGQGLHIIRVLERTEAGVTSLREVQDEIRSKLRKEKIAKSQRKVMEDMQVRIPVWSLFPEDTPGALPLPRSITRHYQSSNLR